MAEENWARREGMMVSLILSRDKISLGFSEELGVDMDVLQESKQNPKLIATIQKKQENN